MRKWVKSALHRIGAAGVGIMSISGGCRGVLADSCDRRGVPQLEEGFLVCEDFGTRGLEGDPK